MKKNYLKPSMKVINLKQRSMILCGSGTDPKSDSQSEEQDYSDAKPYNDWFN